MKQYDYLIVGCGLYGATFAYRARQAGKTCLVIDKRAYKGGNIYCEEREGIRVHKFGAHIFHTSDKKVWDFVNRFVEFNRYTNSPVAYYRGKLYNLPFNMNTFYQMWGVTTPEQARQKMEEQKADAVAAMRADGVSLPRNLEEQALTLIGRDIYEKLIKGYTEKQWGRKCVDLPAFIINRLPVRWVFDNNYFNDRYQGIPIGGYNRLIDGLLEDTDVALGVNYFALRPYIYKEKDEAGFTVRLSPSERLREVLPAEFGFAKLVYTGAIDEFFDYRLGRLSYRTVRFEEETLDIPNFQGNALVNYTDADVPYTRIIEHKHFEYFGNDVYQVPRTILSREFATEWEPGMEPFYPVNDEQNNRLAARYRELGEQTPGVVFGGRLAEYRYYDMAPIVDKVLRIQEF